MKYKFGICGPFDFDEIHTGGQSVKTREFYYGLCEAIGKDKISILESMDYKRNPILFFVRFILLLRNCEHIVIFPAQNGIKIFAPLCSLFKGKHKVHYSVIGGWLPQMVRENPTLLKYIGKFDSILVETNGMKQELENQGLTNVHRLLNFKRLNPVKEIHSCQFPLRLCYFSRILKQKGIEDAVAVVKEINAGGIKCIFDIYGPVVDGYDEEFEVTKSLFTPEIKYMGKIDPSKSVETLKNYDIQLFPTLYKTEGIPGSIVDSYFAALPVVASMWNGFEDVVKNNITGVGYKFGSRNDLKEKLNYLILNPDIIDVMRVNCLEEAKNYLPENVISVFFSIIDFELEDCRN